MVKSVLAHSTFNENGKAMLGSTSEMGQRTSKTGPVNRRRRGMKNHHMFVAPARQSRMQ
jgi:hypothetical protein